MSTALAMSTEQHEQQSSTTSNSGGIGAIGSHHPIFLQQNVIDALRRNDKRRDSELVAGILFDRVDADEMSSYVRFIRRCVEQEIASIQSVEKDGGLVEYVRSLEARLAQAVAETQRLQAKEHSTTTATTATTPDTEELLDAFDTEDRELLQRALHATKTLQTVLECFHSLDRRDLGYSGTPNDRLVAKVTFFYFLSCTRSLQEFAFRSTHPQRPPHRTPMPRRDVETFKPGLCALAERYANREIDGAVFVERLKRLYMFGTPDACSPPSRKSIK